ncbi:MAG: hypothetical protein GY940_43555, partial [bacterium]|nr:hypothetical protein [bacterium]
MKKFRNLKIKNKLIAIILSITLFSVIVGFTGIIIYNKSNLESTFVDEAKTIATVIGNGMVSVLSFGSSDEGNEVLTDFLAEVQTIKNAFVYGERDELFSSYKQSESYKMEAPKVSKKTLNTFQGNYFHILRTIDFKNKERGSIYLRISTEELDNKIKKLILAMLLVIIVIFALSLILATKLQAIISTPILDLGHVTKQVSAEGNYSIRVCKSTSDEVGMLYD